MHELIRSEHVDAGEAAARCKQALVRRWKRFRIAYAFLPPRERDDLVAVLAWHALVFDIVDGSTNEGALERGVRALRDAVESAYTDDPICPIAAALRPAVRRHRLSALTFLGALDELGRSDVVRTFATRRDLLRHAGRLAHPQARHLLTIMGRNAERDELLANALAEGLQLTSWMRCLKDDVDRGRLHVAVEDLERHGIDLFSLRDGASTEPLRAVVRDQVLWAREQLRKGWPLCTELGWRWGRILAFVLRWHAADLSAIEARRYDAIGRTRSGRALRLAACATAAAASSRSPF